MEMVHVAGRKQVLYLKLIKGERQRPVVEALIAPDWCRQFSHVVYEGVFIWC